MDRRKALKGLGLSVGYIVATPTLVNMLQSCKTDAAEWSPSFFTTNEGKIIKSLIDLMLPKTEDLPGALDVNVPEFLDHYVSKIYTEKRQKSFKNDINAIMVELNVSNTSTIELKMEDYDLLLAKYLKASEPELEKFESNEAETQVLNSLRGLRSTAIWAYKTSEQIGETVLAYDPVPGKQLGCISLEEATGGKSWSL